jgi:hypothetical protein
MNYKHIALSFFLFLFGQIIVWVQVNGPLIWTWAKDYRYLLMVLGIPITWLFMEATRFSVIGFGNLFWPGRFISFTAGIFYIYGYDLFVSRRSNQCKNCNIFSISIFTYFSTAILEIRIFIIDAKRISDT